MRAEYYSTRTGENLETGEGVSLDDDKLIVYDKNQCMTRSAFDREMSRDNDFIEHILPDNQAVSWSWFNPTESPEWINQL